MFAMFAGYRVMMICDNSICGPSLLLGSGQW